MRHAIETEFDERDDCFSNEKKIVFSFLSFALSSIHGI